MYKNILLPVVFDNEEGTEKALNVARQFAEPSTKFTVIHVIEELPGYVTGRLSDDVLAKRSDGLQESLDTIAAKLNGANAKLVSGHSGQTIVHFADANDIDCIILSSHTPNFADHFIGSTANRVVHVAKCAVHVIR